MNPLLIPSRLVIGIESQPRPHSLGPLRCLFLREGLWDDYITVLEKVIDLFGCVEQVDVSGRYRIKSEAGRER